MGKHTVKEKYRCKTSEPVTARGDATGKGATQVRRIKTEENTKVVVSVWGEEFIQFLATLAVLPRMNLKNRMKSSFSFKSSVQFNSSKSS